MSASPAISRRLMLGLPLGLVAVGAGIGVMSFRSQEQVLTLSGQTMGTSYSVIAIDPAGSVDAAQVEAMIGQVLATADRALSNWNDASELSQFNALAAGETFAPSRDLLNVLQASEQIRSATGGRFDVAIGDLINLWGFGTTGTRADAPTPYAVESLMDSARVAALEFDANGGLIKGAGEATLFIPSIGKGAGVDALAAGLRGLGLENFMVEIGGDLVTAGLNPDGEQWKIGIESPNLSSVEEVVAISGLAMATSGDYRNYFEVDGQRFSHIIDPLSGMPIAHSTASVTVFADDAMQADAWSTALLVMGLDQGLAFANANAMSALFIEREAAGYKLHGSAAFQALQG